MNLFLLIWIVLCQTTALLGAPLPQKTSMQQRFPEKFLMGSAVSGFQAEMGCPHIPAENCEDRQSDWYQFVTQPHFINNKLLFLSGDDPAHGPGFYETYREDIQRIRQDMGHNSLRLSIEWSRIFPQETFGVNGFDELRALASLDALNFYHGVFRSMREQGIQPLVTLNHSTLPLWIHDATGCHRNLKKCTRKGWANPSMIVPEIAKFAGFIAQEFGQEVDLWATLNEPLSGVVIPSYLLPSPYRSNPPGLHLQIKAAKLANRAMIEAHARMYDAIHEKDQGDADGDGENARVGLVAAYAAIHPKRNQSGDIQAAKNMRYINNEMFLNAVIYGQLDENWDGKIQNRPDLMGRMDYIGINYYTYIQVQKAWIPVLKLISPFLDFDPIQIKVPGDHPEGLYEVIAELSRYKKPMIITETGVVATDDAASVERWLVQTLAWTRQSIADGFDVQGYYYWTLLDNYEWNIGSSMKMGLYSINPFDPLKQRIPRSGVAVYRSITDSWAIPSDVWEHNFPE